MSFHAPSSYTTTTTTTTTATCKFSPRRPSLASIFRIGNNDSTVSSGGDTPGVVEDPSSCTGASEHDLAVAAAATGEDSNNSVKKRKIGIERIQVLIWMPVKGEMWEETERERLEVV